MREYTVKEFAELAKVTPQAIYKQIGNPESLIQQYVVKREGKTFIQDSALQAIYGVDKLVNQPSSTGSATDETGFNNQFNNVEQPEPTGYMKDYIASLNTQIDYLKRQIEEKDAHITELTLLASKALNTTSQQQYLTAAVSGLQPDEQPVAEVEQPVKQPVEQPTAEVDKPVEQVEQLGKKRGWFHRLFFNDD